MGDFKKNLYLSFIFLAIIFGWITIRGYFGGTVQAETGDEPEEIQIKEFVLFTMPKTGTHLARPLLEYLTDRNSVSYWAKDVKCAKSYLYDKNMTSILLQIPNVVQAYWLHQPIPSNHFTPILDNLAFTEDFFVTHAPFSKEMESVLKERNTVVFFLIRDPRDWVISVIRHPPISGVDLYGGPIGDVMFQSLSMDQKIDYIISGTPKYYSGLEVYEKFLPWINSPICCTLRFEALLGPKGGAYSQEEQLHELRKISAALKLDLSDEMLLEAFNDSYGVGKVFSKGKAASWKGHFNEEHKEKFKESFGDLLIQLGYEKDNNW